MEDGRIKNHQITASSDFGPMYKAYFGRVNQVASSITVGCWHPMHYNPDEYLQVDLEKAKYITMVATQGRPLEGGSWPGYYQWTKTYAVKFSDDVTNWADYSEGGVIKIFSGNTDSETVVKHDLVEPIKARYVRFMVKSWHNEPVMRVELYGCEP
ncbi:lactadherin [Nematostella vectensis]|uniref:lactadherin n=1 Tax=Nematostella vectensis TaxID=45351 RepID=UPI0020773757|nr:lactadherin [Nematostella vectensis]